MTDKLDEISALAAALREAAEKHPELDEPINQVAKNVRRLTRNPNDAALMRETGHMVASLLVALGKMPPSEMP